MKKTLQFMLAGAIMLSAFVACSDDEEDTKKKDDSSYGAEATISSSDANVTFSSDKIAEVYFKAEGGSATFTVNCEVEWTVDNVSADLFATSVTSTTLVVSAGQNLESRERTGTIILRTANDGVLFATINVIQAAYGAPEISAELTDWNFPAVSGTLMTKEIAVEATADWTAEASDAWLTVSTTENVLSLTAAENTLTEGRSTKVTLTCTDGINTAYEYINVSQDAKATITLSPESLEFSGSASSANVDVTTDFDWTSSCEASWITLTASGNVLTVAVTENDSTEEREGTVTITAGDGAENVAEAQLSITQGGKDISDMILTYTITSGNTTATLPLGGVDKCTVDCTVDWGDGSTAETVTTSYPTHKYASAGTYDITISGTMTALSVGKGFDSTGLITGVKQWGMTGLTSLNYAFSQCSKLASLPERSYESLSKVTDFYGAFYQCTSLTVIPEKLFENCSAATDFDRVFMMDTGIKSIPEGLFADCTNATSFASAFSDCSNLTGESAYDLVDGVKVHLYERGDYSKVYATPKSYTSCYSQCKNLTDYYDIPSGWGGGGAK